MARRFAFRSVRGRSERIWLLDVASGAVHARALLSIHGPDDRLIGVELIAPTQVTLDDVNQVLRDHGFALLTMEELSPLVGAA